MLKEIGPFLEWAWEKKSMPGPGPKPNFLGIKPVEVRDLPQQGRSNNCGFFASAFIDFLCHADLNGG
jgi:hypothetical protein